MTGEIRFILFVTIFAISLSLVGQNIKIASLAPESTPWGEGLNRLASEWARISNGRVRLTVFHGGVAGDEEDAIRKMRLGQLQGVVITNAGMANIVPETLGISFPGIIENSDELDFVIREMSDTLDRFFEGSRYEVITWSNGGWLKLFSTFEITHPDDLQRLKIAGGTLPEQIYGAFRNMGMQPVPLGSTDVLASLSSGLIESVVYAPLAVAGLQWFGVADHMLELEMAPFLGSMIIDRQVWNRIPANMREELTVAAVEMSREVDARLQELEDEAVELMEEFGLTVVEISDAQEELWRDEFLVQAERVQDGYLNNPIIDEIRDGLAVYRGRIR